MPDENTQEVKGVEIEVAGKKFLVTEAMRDALEAERKKVEEKKKEPEKENLFDFSRKPEKSQKPEKPEADTDDDLWSDPKAYLKKYGDRIKKEVRDEISKEWEEIDARKKQSDEFWTDFYKKNKDLKKSDDFVKYMAQTKLKDLEKIMDKDGTDGVMDRLGEWVRDALVITPPKEEPAPIVEGGPDFKFQEAPKSAEKILSLGDVIKQRRADRNRKRSAAGGK